MKTLFILLIFYYCIYGSSLEKIQKNHNRSRAWDTYLKAKNKTTEKKIPRQQGNPNNYDESEEKKKSEEDSGGYEYYSDEAMTEPPAETTPTIDSDTEEVSSTTEIEIFTEFDIYKYMNVTDKDSMTESELEDLSAATFAALMNQTDEQSDDEEDEIPCYTDDVSPFTALSRPGQTRELRLKKFTGDVYNANKDYWKIFRQKMTMSMEYMLSLHHVGNHEHRVRGCYFIGVSYMNAITDIHNYSKIRYLYTNNLHYEVGYLVQEIIGHYQIAVELYHLMLVKYAKNKHKFFAPTMYMLYIYTNILDQCKTIIHLSAMLHELEGKYKNHPRTIFQDEKGFFKNASKSSGNMNSYQNHVMQQKKRRLREYKKQRKQLFKSGILTSTQRTLRPMKGPFPLHYGWSIETW